MKFINSALIISLLAAPFAGATIIDEATVSCGGNRKKCESLSKIVDKSEKYGVRCCGPNKVNRYWDQNSAECPWAGSRGPGEECNLSATYAEAVAFCQAVNSRLCTHFELTEKLCAKATGCGLNKQYVWSVDEPSTAVAKLGEDHSCAITESKELYCWGFNKKGQLGNGSNKSSAKPFKVTGVGPAAQLASGWRHSCVVDNEHKVFCWGYNKFGQLGVGEFKKDKYVPTQVTFGFNQSGLAMDIAIGAGSTHTCLLDNGNSVWCWGNNSEGQLGLGSTTSQASPVQVAGVVATLIGAGRGHTCAKTSSNGLTCWGSNEYGQFGSGNKVSSTSPVTTTMPTDIQKLAMGVSHSCIIGVDQQLWCFGANKDGQLGVGDYADKTMPHAVMSGIQNAGAGYKHTCAVDLEFKLYCWGKSSWGQLGTGVDRVVGYNLPREIKLFRNQAVQVSLGMYHTCAVDEFGKLFCWGKGVYGQIGNNSYDDVSSPVMVQDISFD